MMERGKFFPHLHRQCRLQPCKPSARKDMLSVCTQPQVVCKRSVVPGLGGHSVTLRFPLQPSWKRAACSGVCCQSSAAFIWPRLKDAPPPGPPCMLGRGQKHRDIVACSVASKEKEDIPRAHLRWCASSCCLRGRRVLGMSTTHNTKQAEGPCRWLRSVCVMKRD